MALINAAILGCTGMVGRQFVRMLEDHPFFRIKCLFASKTSAGKMVGDYGEWIGENELSGRIRRMIIQEFDLKQLRENQVKVVFSALPAGIARDIEGAIRREGLAVFSNASAFRMDHDVPILIPEVNETHLMLIDKQKSLYGGFVVTNSNCSASGLVMALKPIMGFGLRSISVSTYQAISGGGLNGVRAWDIQGNILPFIRGEEEKMITESRKILGDVRSGNIETWDVHINASCCRVPVRNGHLESVVLELENEVELSALTEAWRSFRASPQTLLLPTAPDQPIIVRTEENRPQPVEDCLAGTPIRARGMSVTIGRIRKQENWIQFFLLVNNTIRGAAGTCILNAELLHFRRLLPTAGGSLLVNKER